MNVADLANESDSSDEDYVPNEKTEDLPSEIDEDEPLSDPEETVQKYNKIGKTSRKRKGFKKHNKTETEAVHANTNKLNGDEKVQIDDLWADFVKDTGFKSKTDLKSDTIEPESSKKTVLTSSSNVILAKKLPEKVKVTQIFEFAGEEVKVEKEVPADSAEARLLAGRQASDSFSVKRPAAGLSGISNVLNQLNKKAKISTLEKTKLDWDSYKKEHKIEEELETFNKGKDGYLERQDFLQRTDLRRFEIEKDIRDVERNKRFNSTL